MTNRWQTFTDCKVTPDTIKDLSAYCDEFLIHGVDVEGKRQGIDDRLLELLSRTEDVKITYAGGVKSLDDIRKIKEIGQGRIDVTVGSALKMFGGTMSVDEILDIIKA